MLELLLWPKLKEGFPDHLLFQQNGILLHYNFDVREFMDEQLPGSLIGHRGLTPWPPRP